MKRKINSENYLERIPVHNPAVKWTADEKGNVTLEVENTGFYNRIAQRFFGRPRTSYIHLDSFGSFVWMQADENRNIIEIGNKVKDKFGEDAEPLYERLAKFFQILESYKFIMFNK